MKILFTGKNHSQALKTLDPSSLSGVAKSLGFDSVNSLGDAPDVVICVDFHKSALPIVRNARYQRIQTVLVMNEPEVVIPQHSQKKILNKFDKVVKVGRPDPMDNLKWPQTWVPIAKNIKRQDRVVLVNADKWSFIKGQHYWLRAAASTKIDVVDTFGIGWERPIIVRLAHRIFELWRTIASRAVPNFHGFRNFLARPRFLKGSVVDKIAAMSDYKVALVVENSSELLTEKLFDAWFAGCVPVYLGPPVQAFGLPGDLVIQVKAPTLLEVKSSIEEALSFDSENYFRKLQEYLSSGIEEQWGAESALREILLRAIGKN